MLAVLPTNGWVIPPEIACLKRLTYIGLRENVLKELPPEMGELPNLHTCVVDQNDLSQLPPDMGKLQRLVVLSAENNRLTDLPDEISQLPALRSLSLDGNRLSAKAQARLRQLLPHTNIDFGRQVGGEEGIGQTIRAPVDN